MAEISYPWSTTGVGDGTALGFTFGQWQEAWESAVGSRAEYNAVVHSYLNDLNPANTPGTSNITINTGTAFVKGTFYKNSALQTLIPGVGIYPALPAVSQRHYVVLEKDVNLQTVRLDMISGTDAVSPTYPTLTQDAINWEVPLCSFRINAAGVVTEFVDMRCYTQSSAVQRTSTFSIAADDSPGILKSIADYVCDGVDDQVQINAAILALGSLGGSVFLTTGTYSISAQITLASNVTIIGSGSSTIIKIDDAVVAGMTMIRAEHLTGIKIRSICLNGNRATCTGTPQSGIVFHHVTNSKIEDCYLYSLRDFGIIVEGASYYDHVIHNLFYDGGAAFVAITLQAEGGQIPRRVQVRGNSIGDGNDGIYLVGASECIIDGNYVETVRTNISLGASNARCIITNNFCRGSAGVGTGHGIHVLSSDEILINNNITWYAGLDGICIESSTYCILASNYIKESGRNGIGLITAQRSTIVGNIVHTASQSVDATYSGITFNTTTVYCTVQTNFVRGGAGAAQSAYGIDIDATSTGNFFINNDVQGGGRTGNLRDLGGNTFRQNLGYVTENSGTAHFETAATVVVNHGLAATPTRVIVTPRANPGGNLWVHTVGAAQFTIEVSAGTPHIDCDWNAWISDTIP